MGAHDEPIRKRRQILGIYTQNSEIFIFNTGLHEHIIYNINNSNSNNNNQITVVMWYMHMSNKPSSCA